MFVRAVCVFCGAGCGACLRWLFTLLLSHSWQVLQLGTLTANITGCFLAGIASGFFYDHPALPQEYKLLLVTGFLGGLTTFSAFSEEIFSLFHAARHSHAFAALALNLLGALAAVALGYLVYAKWLQSS